MNAQKREFKSRIALLITSLLLIFMLLTGCGSAETGDDETVRIGIVQLTEHASLDLIRESIVKKLEAEGYKDGETIRIDYRNAQNDQSNLKTICQGFAAADVDVSVAITTPAAQAAMGETKDIPIVFSAVTDPMEAGLVESLENPGGNVTGTSDVISAENIMELASEITPDFKTIGALYDSSETNSVSVIEELRGYAEENGLKIVESAVSGTDEIRAAAQNLSKKCDIVFSPADNTVASAITAANQVFIETKTPFYTGADSMVKDGAFAACGVDYRYIGSETAEMIIDIINGADPAKMAVRSMDETGIYISGETAKKIGVQIPESILKNSTDPAEEGL